MFIDVVWDKWRNLKLNDREFYRQYNIYRQPYIANASTHPYSNSIMSTIRAKQEICLNICTIRSFSTYSAGRYCLRFCLWETYNNSSGSDSPDLRYAIPVSVVEYNSSASHHNTPSYDISDTYYHTKPFMLKSGIEVPIHEICVFKHDINIFNSRYESDFYEITMKCKCELISYDYSGEEGKVVSTFDGRIKGVGISDSMVIDFSEGLPCQVIGTVHNCVYQFQYMYAGQLGPHLVMKNSLNVEHMLRAESRQGGRAGEAMNFQKYCQLQSKEYVQSLLEYLLSEVNKSDQKITLNLDLFNKITQKPNTSIEMSPEREEEYSIELQRSIRSQSQLEASSIIDEEMKQRLSILKAESKFYCPADGQIIIDEEDDFQMKKHEQDQQYVCIVLDSDQQEKYQQNPNLNPSKIPAMQNPSFASVDIIKSEDGAKKCVKKERIFTNQVSVQNHHKTRGKLIDEVHDDVEKIMCKDDKVKTEAQQAINGKQQDTHKNKNTRRRKIFVHSNTNANGRNESANQPQSPQFQQVLLNNSSVYQARYVASNQVRGHPSKCQSKSKGVNSKVTIEQFQKMLHGSCLNIYEKWRKFISYLAEPEGMLLVNAYKAQYRKKQEALLGQSVIRFKGSLDIDIYSKEQAQRNKMAYQIRSQVPDNEKNIMVNQFRFYNKSLFSTKKPIMFVEKFQQLKQLQQQSRLKHAPKKSFLKVSLSTDIAKQKEAQHIIFLVHGLGACRLDMDRLRIEIKRNFKQKVHVVCSYSNEGRTEGNIDLMGVRLGHEVEQELAKNYGKCEGIQNKSLRISFIGHSMGGIIIRSALPRLEKYKHFFHSFVTLSSPHLGYCYSSSKLIDVGLWLINNWQKCESILQLTMSDVPKNSNPKARFNMEDTFLYKLSLEKGLEWFKKVTFLASRQDLYVPYFSARVQKHDECINDLRSKDPYAIIHSKMVDNILSRVSGDVTRIDVNFCITQQNIDNLIGRAAHINFVNSVDFLRLLCVTDEETLI